MISLLALSEDISSRAFNFYWVLIDIRSSGGRGALTYSVVWCQGRELLCSIKSWRNGNVYVVSNYFRYPLNVFANCPGICLSKLPSITRCLPSPAPGSSLSSQESQTPNLMSADDGQGLCATLSGEEKQSPPIHSPKLSFHLNLRNRAWKQEVDFRLYAYIAYAICIKRFIKSVDNGRFTSTQVIIREWFKKIKGHVKFMTLKPY